MIYICADKCPDCRSVLRLRRRTGDVPRIVCTRCKFTSDWFDREREMLATIASLRAQLANRRPEPEVRIVYTSGTSRDLIKKVIQIVHPDKHDGAEWAHRITCELTELLSKL